MKTRIKLMNPETGEPEFPIISEGKTIDVAQISILAKHRDLYATGTESDVAHSELASRLYVWGIPKDHNDSRYNHPILTNYPLNLPHVTDKNKAIWTVVEADIIQEYIGFIVEIETRPMQEGLITIGGETTIKDQYNGTGVKLNKYGSATTTDYYPEGYDMQKNYLTNIQHTTITFRTTRSLVEGTNNTGVNPT